MRKMMILGLLSLFGYFQAQGQVVSDQLLIQDFETTPAAPTWSYTAGALINTKTGNSNSGDTPPNSPVGINGSTAWHIIDDVNTLTFDNFIVPSGYDNLTASFRLAAMNFNNKLREDPIKASGRASDNDDVLVEISTDGGATFYPRVRVRGKNITSSNKAYWEYAATGVAEVAHLPMSEELFQPADGGVRTTDGYSTVRINFPNTVTQIQIRITSTSNSVSDSWLIDNVELLGNRTVAPPIPTMSQWGLLIFGLLVLNVSVFFVYLKEEDLPK